MHRFRVHLIIHAKNLPRPMSFRIDIFQTENDPEKAYASAIRAAQQQTALEDVRILSGGSSDRLEITA